jgi:hypothetical protein
MIMSNYLKLATDAGDQYLTSLAEMQENFLKATAAYAGRFTVPMPAAMMPTAFNAPDVPTPAEVTEASFSFAQKLLKQQKTFAEKLLATNASVLATGSAK